MNEYVVYARYYLEDEAPLEEVVRVEGFGFAHALERALGFSQSWTRAPRVGDLVVVSTVTRDGDMAQKVFKLTDCNPWKWKRP